MNSWLRVSAFALLLAGAPLAASLAQAQTLAQAAAPTPLPTSKTAKPAKPTEAPQAPPKVQRAEVITAGNWTVTCAELDQPGGKARCSGVLKIAQDRNNVQRVVFSWVIGQKDGKPVSVMSIPPGILIGPGVVLKVGAGEGRKFNYTLCQPDHCEALVPLDDPLIKELESSPTAEVSVVAVNGANAKFNVNLAGFEQAMAEVTK